MINDAFWNKWTDYVHSEFGVNLNKNQIIKFKTYLALIIEWNNKFNLVSFKSEEEILWRHFADSISCAKMITKHCPNASKIADIGTGAGFPGIPLKIVFPDTKLTLIESITKKCTFLEHVVHTLNLENVEIINDRAENLGHQKVHREAYDIILSRALSKFSSNLETTIPLVKLGKHSFIYKTERSAFGDKGLSCVEKPLKILGSEFIDHFCYDRSRSGQMHDILRFLYEYAD